MVPVPEAELLLVLLLVRLYGYGSTRMCDKKFKKMKKARNKKLSFFRKKKQELTKF
jgi:hypothetical protein